MKTNKSILTLLLLCILLFGCSGESEKPVAIMTNERPELTVLSSTEAYVEIPLNVTLRANDENQSPSIQSSLLPDGAIITDNLDGTANIQWVPDSSDLGVYPVTVYATDAVDTSLIDSITFNITVSYQPTTVSKWNPYDSLWETTLTLYDSVNYTYFSFISADTTTQTNDNWHLGFKREEIILHDQLTGADSVISDARFVYNRTFETTTVTDTANQFWFSNESGYAIDEWLFYAHPTKSALRIFIYPYLYILKDATGQNYLSFRVDSVNNVNNLGEMGDVYISYNFQSNPNDVTLPADSVKQLALQIGTGSGYIDFSQNARVFPSNPLNSLDWDICFENQSIRTNSSLHGIGAVQVYPAYIGSIDSTSFELFQTVDTLQRFITDFYRNPFLFNYEREYNKNWFEPPYQNYSIIPKEKVYIIRSNGKHFKLQITSYSSDSLNTLFGGELTFKWLEIQ